MLRSVFKTTGSDSLPSLLLVALALAPSLVERMLALGADPTIVAESPYSTNVLHLAVLRIPELGAGFAHKLMDAIPTASLSVLVAAKCWVGTRYYTAEGLARELLSRPNPEGRLGLAGPHLSILPAFSSLTVLYFSLCSNFVFPYLCCPNSTEFAERLAKVRLRDSTSMIESKIGNLIEDLAKHAKAQGAASKAGKQGDDQCGWCCDVFRSKEKPQLCSQCRTRKYCSRSISSQHAFLQSVCASKRPRNIVFALSGPVRSSTGRCIKGRA